MRQYTQLTQEQRYPIYALMKAGHNQTETARIPEVPKSTISRELRRNRGLCSYRPQPAERLAVTRRQGKAKVRIPPDHWDWVDALLREEWSPEQVSLWLAQEKCLRISHEWIYHYILRDKQQGGDLYRHLRCHKPRRKRYGHVSRRGQWSGRVCIEERPAIVDRRSRWGTGYDDW